jgi:hypothetical protein
MRHDTEHLGWRLLGQMMGLGYKGFCIFVLLIFQGGCRPMAPPKRSDATSMTRRLQTGVSCPQIIADSFDNWARARNLSVSGTMGANRVMRVGRGEGYYVEAFYSVLDGNAEIQVGVVSPGKKEALPDLEKRYNLSDLLEALSSAARCSEDVPQKAAPKRPDGEFLRERVQVQRACPEELRKVIDSWAWQHGFAIHGELNGNRLSRFARLHGRGFVEAFYSVEDYTADLHVGLIVPNATPNEREDLLKRLMLAALMDSMRRAAFICRAELDGQGCAVECPAGQICFHRKCVRRERDLTCRARCCKGRDDGCSVSHTEADMYHRVRCFCDEYCRIARDCCADVQPECHW